MCKLYGIVFGLYAGQSNVWDFIIFKPLLFFCRLNYSLSCWKIELTHAIFYPDLTNSVLAYEYMYVYFVTFLKKQFKFNTWEKSSSNHYRDSTYSTREKYILLISTVIPIWITSIRKLELVKVYRTKININMFADVTFNNI